MNEFVYVEFLIEDELFSKHYTPLHDLGDDFRQIGWPYSEGRYIRITGNINSMAASILKLSNPFLAERMRISHIPDSLKNKYR